MSIKKLLIANRGEIAVRIAGAAAELGIETVAIYSDDDSASLHTRKTDHRVGLGKNGVAAYLDGATIINIASEQGCDAIHPGYGFLAENANFVRQCDVAGIVFVGPDAEVLDLFGDKAKARTLAEQCGVPVIEGTSGATTLAGVKEFYT